jgi:hypothetical protein
MRIKEIQGKRCTKPIFFSCKSGLKILLFEKVSPPAGLQAYKLTSSLTPSPLPQGEGKG